VGAGVVRCSLALTARPVLRERYLRDDIPCAIEGCHLCPSSSDDDVLPASGARDHPSYPHGHYLLPDTNVFLAQVRPVGREKHRIYSHPQMDLVESELFTAPLILLQTVLEEVRHRSLPLYNRLKALSKIEDKRICVFYNEYRTYVICLDVLMDSQGCWQRDGSYP
jgi:exosome complex exonuclease DIS3/RRP44